MMSDIGSLDRAALATLAVRFFPDGAVTVFDKDLRYLLADGDLDIGELTTDTVEGRTVNEVFPPETAALLEEPYRAAVDEGRRTTFFAEYKGRSYEVLVQPLKEDGAIIAGLSITRDVTHQRDVERSLDEAEQRFRSAFENAPIGIALVGLDGSWLRVNPRIPELLGYTEAELLSRSFQDITHPDDLDTDLGFVAKMLSGEIRTYQMEKRYLHKDGRVVWALLSVSLVRGEDDAPRYFVSQIVDITERQRYEEQLATHARDVERANDSLRAMDELKGEFIAVAAHELKTPLTSVRGSISTLRAHWKSLPDADRQELLDMADWQAERLHTLTDELLTLSRIENGLLEVIPDDVLVGPVAVEIIEYLSPPIPFETFCDEGVSVTVDPAQFRQMLTNYVTNAVKYGRPPFSIEVSRAGADVDIRVRDHGDGVGPTFVERLFDKFSRSNAQGDIPGTGLGLSIVRGLAEANGGSTWYEGSDKGSVFVLRLPAGA